MSFARGTSFVPTRRPSGDASTASCWILGLAWMPARTGPRIQLSVDAMLPMWAWAPTNAAAIMSTGKVRIAAHRSAMRGWRTVVVLWKRASSAMAAA